MKLGVQVAKGCHFHVVKTEWWYVESFWDSTGTLQTTEVILMPYSQPYRRLANEALQHYRSTLSPTRSCPFHSALYAKEIHFSTHDLTNFSVVVGWCSLSFCFHPLCPKPTLVSGYSRRPGLRSANTANTADYIKRRTRTKFGERCFSHAGPAAWNSLPDSI